MSRTAWGLDTSHAAGWIAQAACQDEDPELFFPISYGQTARSATAAAVAICHRCPVLDSCRTWALDVGETYGVWGGLSEAELIAAARSGRG